LTPGDSLRTDGDVEGSQSDHIWEKVLNCAIIYPAHISTSTFSIIDLHILTSSHFHFKTRVLLLTRQLTQSQQSPHINGRVLGTQRPFHRSPKHAFPVQAPVMRALVPSAAFDALSRSSYHPSSHPPKPPNLNTSISLTPASRQITRKHVPHQDRQTGHPRRPQHHLQRCTHHDPSHPCLQ
jgi:hypothetical protein